MKRPRGEVRSQYTIEKFFIWVTTMKEYYKKTSKILQ